MDRNALIQFCKKYKLEIQSDITPYGVKLIVYVDNKSIDSNEEFSDLRDWAYDLHDIIVNKLEILDSYNCNVDLIEDTIKFDFQFNNSWEYEGQYEMDRVTPSELLPYLPDFIVEYEEFKKLDLDEESLYCSFTYDEKSNKDISINIHNLWSEGEIEMSFISHKNLIIDLKNELTERVKEVFNDYDELWLCSEDGIDISVSSTYKSVITYDELFGESVQ